MINCHDYFSLDANMSPAYLGSRGATSIWIFKCGPWKGEGDGGDEGRREEDKEKTEKTKDRRNIMYDAKHLKLWALQHSKKEFWSVTPWV